MINIWELRTGNEVFIDGDTRCTVVQIDSFSQSVGLAGIFDMLKPKEIDPIPLTPEILVQCGFEKGDYHGAEQWLGPWIERHNPYTKNRLGIMRDMYGFYYAGETFSVRLDHLHTLQNLYFFNTGGTELILKTT